MYINLKILIGHLERYFIYFFVEIRMNQALNINRIQNKNKSDAFD